MSDVQHVPPVDSAPALAPRPGCGFPAHFERAVRGSLPLKRLLLLVVALAFPVLLSLPDRGASAAERGDQLTNLVMFLFLELLVPLAGLLFGAGILMSEESSGALPYIFSRASARPTFVLARFCAFLIIGEIALAASACATLLAFPGAAAPPHFALRMLLAVAVAYPAYLAGFAVLSAFTRWALFGGFLYAFGVEGFIDMIPGNARHWTVLYYSRSILGAKARSAMPVASFFGEIAKPSPASMSRSVVTLVLVATVALAVACFVVARKQFVRRNAGRA